MSEDYSEESYNTTTSQSQGQSALLIRLDTSKLLEDLEMYLTGQILVVSSIDGQFVQKREQKAKPKANPEGIHGILAWVQSCINNQIVQGNFCKYEDYERYIYHMRKDFATDLMLKVPEWDIDDTDYPFIIDFVMNMAETFLTRLIGNKERESYTQTMRVHESNTVSKEDSGGIKIFGNYRRD